MSLFTDSNHVTQADLVALDPQIAEIAIAEEFTVSALIARAWDECAEIIQRACASEYGEFTDPVLAYHTGGWPSGVQLSRIVVTSPYANSASTLQRWMTWKAIEVFYRAAAARGVNDRYEAKLERARSESANAWRAVYSAGVPTVSNPLPCPGALHELGAGVFDADNVTTESGTSDGGQFRVAITWLDANGVESGPSAAVDVSVEPDSVIRVDVGSLGAPGVVAVTRSGAYSLLTATHWNVYAGVVGSTLRLQNAEPIVLATTHYTLDSDPTTSGAALGGGQAADGVQRFQRTVGRG
jgi:hypothetical protein